MATFKRNRLRFLIHQAIQSVAFQYTSFMPTRTINVSNTSQLQAALALGTLQAGDDIVLANGIYEDNADRDLDGHIDSSNARFSGAFYPGITGTQSQPIRIRAANPGGATLRTIFATANRGPIFSISNRAYIILSDVVLEGQRNCLVDSGFLTLTNSNHIYIENVVINGAQPPVGTIEQTNHAGIYIQKCTHVRVGNCFIQNITFPENGVRSHNGEGILCYSVQDSTFEFNSLTNIGSVALYEKGEVAFANANNTWRYNHVYGCPLARGFQVTGHSSSQRTRVYQNLFVGCEQGFRLHYLPNYMDGFNNTIVDTHNTDAANDTYGGLVVSYGGGGSGSNNRLWGNIVFGLTSVTPSWDYLTNYFEPSTTYTSQYNLFNTGERHKQNGVSYNTLVLAQQAGHEVGSIEHANPFVDYNGGNYRLGAAYTNGAFVPDVSGVYGEPVVPGCYITGTEQIGRAA